jgi:TrpR family transcriptional regulator, trp operon repressor
MNTNDQAHFKELVDFLLQAKDRRAMGNRLRALLTPSELHDIPNRLKITRLLKQGLTQREIAKQLGVGIATVSRGSKAMNDIEHYLDMD